MDHRIALQLEKKVGPKPWFYDRPPPDPNAASRAKYWDQTMYVSYSRTRADFPHLKKVPQPEQEP